MGKFKFIKEKQRKTEENDQKPQAQSLKEPAPVHTQDSGNCPVAHSTSSGNQQKFKFLKDKALTDRAQTLDDNPTSSDLKPKKVDKSGTVAELESKDAPKITPGSNGEHRLQEKWGTEDRAHNFYDRQVLDYLSPLMKEFLVCQEFMFVSTADRNGECDCTSKFGKPGFIHILSDKYLMYPEFRGNGVYANSGNVTENPHIALLIIDFTKDTVGLHINGRARLVENDELLQYQDKLADSVIDLLNQEGKKCPERWMMIEVEEAYIQCSKHIPLMQKLDKKIDWGTDNVASKGGDYFKLQEISLYDRVGGDKAMEIAVDLFYRKVLSDNLVSHFFEDTDMEGQRLKQKSFLSMAFGGPYEYSGRDLREVHHPIKERFGLTDEHFDRVGKLFNETLEELNISKNEITEMLETIESMRDDVLIR